MMGRVQRGATLPAVIAALAAPTAAIAQAGYDELVKRLGSDAVPTGAEVVVGQVEALNGSGNYRPNPIHEEFKGKTITLLSGPSSNSGHATTVGRNFYGLDTSIAPGIPSIFVWEVNDWLTNELRFTAGNLTPPLITPEGIKIVNHSWVGNGGPDNNSILRRADFLASRDDVLLVVGVNNEAAQQPLLSHMFNGITVGVESGDHAIAPTISGVDAPGRMKPEIVAPGNLTSWSTPVAAAAVALLVETARTDPLLMGNPNAERIEVLKAALLAGADHGPKWTNNPATSGPDRGVTAQPIDEVFGAGAVNVNRSHFILTGGQQPGEARVPAQADLANVGWDLSALLPGESRYWRFALNAPATEISILTTWHRVVVPTNMSSWYLPQFDLELWRIDETGQAVPLVGDDNARYFAAGNVVSESVVDNVEHLFVRDLAPGEYVFELRRTDSVPVAHEAAVAWIMPEAVSVPGDLTGDGVVNVLDLLALIEVWGACENCPADLNDDGVVNVLDLLAIIGLWTGG